MKYLFVHQNFPGQYVHVLRHLVAQDRHEILFVSLPNANQIAGVRRIDYQPIQPSAPGIHGDAFEFERAMIRARSVAQTCQRLAAIGFRPDIVLGHNGWGELLNIRDVWPDVPLVPYFEFFYHIEGLDVGFDPEFPVAVSDHPRIRAKNAVNLLGLQLADRGQTPTLFQRDTYPSWAHRRLTVLPEGVDLETCSPNPEARFGLPLRRRQWCRGGRRLVTYVARNLEPYRGIHTMLRAIPAILAARRDVDIVLVGGDEVSYGPVCTSAGSWRDHFLAKLGGKIDPDRVFFAGKLAYDDYIALLQRSDAHVYLTYPFVASWSLREALACGCAVVASDTAPVREFVEPRRTGLLVPFHEPQAVAQAVLELLEDARLGLDLRQKARRWAETHLDRRAQFQGFDQMVATARRSKRPSGG